MRIPGHAGEVVRRLDEAGKAFRQVSYIQR